MLKFQIYVYAKKQYDVLYQINDSNMIDEICECGNDTIE